MRGQTITESVTLVTETCYACGVLFALESTFRERLLNDPSKSFFCPNGHSQHYLGKSWGTRLKEKDEAIERERRRVANTQEDLRIEKISHSATKGQLTKTRKQVARIEKGVCPHCRRSFANVARHMESKHAEHE